MDSTHFPRPLWARLAPLIGKLALAFVFVAGPARSADPLYPGVGHVFVILMENHDWSTIFGSANCPYVNKQLLPKASYATAYSNPSKIHPSEPNYLWLVAGTNFGILDDHSPATNTKRTTKHLPAQLDAAGILWKAYAEDIPGDTIPIANSGEYAVRHVPFMFFQNINTNRAYVTNHIRPFPELAADLAADHVANYNFITPNLTNDMHNLTPGSPSTRLQGDRWLAANVPVILASAAFKRDGLLIVTWDEGTEGAAGSSGDGPIGCIVVSPQGRGGGYHNAIQYTHSDTLRTVQDVFQLQPYLGDALNARGLRDLFAYFQIDGINATSDRIDVRVIGTAGGKVYRLESTDGLETPSWSVVDTKGGLSVGITLSDTRSGIDAGRYYRVVQAK